MAVAGVDTTVGASKPSVAISRDQQVAHLSEAFTLESFAPHRRLIAASSASSSRSGSRP